MRAGDRSIVLVLIPRCGVVKVCIKNEPMDADDESWKTRKSVGLFYRVDSISYLPKKIRVL